LEAQELSQEGLRTRTIAMFFKSLTCRTPEIVAASKKGLQQVISQHNLPKDLLQSSLRPILGPICANYKHLSLPLLQGLARLLELLSNWFNVTLGEKLLEHLRCVTVHCLVCYLLCYCPLLSVLLSVLMSAAQCVTYCGTVRCPVCYLLCYCLLPSVLPYVLLSAA
jgi:hypothetical protein